MIALAIGATLAGCRSETSGAPAAPPGVTMTRLAVTSPTIKIDRLIPVDYTCDGADRSPPLTFSTPPRGTSSLVVVLEDPDAPGGTFTHWTLYNIAPEVLSLPEAVEPSAVGAVTGENDFHRPGYAGPCPPRLERHRYAFRVYALDTMLTLPAEASHGALDSAMNGHVLARGSLQAEFSH